jgi:hypothetical protein
MNTALKIGIGTGAVLIGYRMLQLNKLAANVSIALSKIRIQKVNLSGIEFAAKVKINNPSNVSAKIVNPVVRLWDHKNSLIAESPATGKTYNIAANQQSEIGDILLPLTWGALFPLIGISNIASLLAVFQKGGTKGMLQAFKHPIAMSVLMQVDGMSIQSPKTILNKK